MTTAIPKRADSLIGDEILREQLSWMTAAHNEAVARGGRSLSIGESILGRQKTTTANAQLSRVLTLMKGPS